MPESAAPRVGQVRWWPVLKWTLTLVVLVFIGRRALEIWKSAPVEGIRINALWLLPASLVYLAGWLPSSWLWHVLMRDMSQPVGMWDAIRAFYISQLGKYVPGKALVLFIRGSMAKEVGANPLLAGMLAACETLVFMAAGAALAIAFAPFALSEPLWMRLPASIAWLRDHPLVLIVIVAAATFATTPFSAWLFTRISRRILRADPAEVAQQPRISARLVSQGVVVTSLGWACHALSLGMVLQSLSPHHFDLAQFPLWLATSTTSMVGGFAVPLAPGGLGVREGIMIEILKDQPQVGPVTAVIAAGLVRVVWFVSEIVAAAILFFCYRRQVSR